MGSVDPRTDYDALPVIVWTSPGDRSWDYVSPRWTEFTGRAIEQELGPGWLDRIHAEDRDGALSQLDEATATGRPFAIEFRARRHDGVYCWIRNAGVPRPTGGYTGWCIDVTDRRALEQRLMRADRAEAIVQLAAGIAHDFNNLLTGIFGHLALLGEQPDLPEDARDDIAQIQQSADRAASLTRQLIAFSRRQVLTPRILDLNRLVTGTVSAIRRMMGSRIQVVPALDPHLDRVLADPGQLEQVLLQLGATARDAMTDGGSFELSTRNVTLGEGDVTRFPGVRHGTYVALVVRDTATPPEPRTAPESIAAIARQSGGFLDVENAADGTTFTLYLPSAESGAVDGTVGEASRLKYAGTETVLVVEDELQVRDLARRVLERSGYTVLAASDAEAAMAIADRHPGHIHLLITDMFLPRLSGRELAARLGIHRPAIKVLYVSGTSDEAIARHRVLAPGTEFLEKPFTLDGLLRKVRQVLGDPESAGALMNQ
ncbi:MAG TPA: response regulator [Gemmatimonadales bacterium]|jgi:PAS domain S-box-containing protein